MINAEVFFYPGELGTAFLLSLFGASPASLDPSIAWWVSLFLALIFWVWAIKIMIAIVKKLFGFERGQHYR